MYMDSQPLQLPEQECSMPEEPRTVNVNMNMNVNVNPERESDVFSLKSQERPTEK